MLTVFLAAALLLGVGFALGRAPLYRLGRAVLFVLVLAPLAVAWLIAVAAFDERLRAVGHPLGDGVALALVTLPPLVATTFLLRALRRGGRPRFLWRLAGRPATLSLPFILLVQAGLLLLVIVGGNLAAAYQEGRAEAAWRTLGEPLEALPTRYPKTATNPAAAEVERLSGEIASTFHASVKNAISAYVFGEAQRTDGGSEQAPLEVRAWLAMNDRALSALERHLREGGPLVWATDIDDWQSPPRFGLVDLHAALLASAFQSAHDRQWAAAAERVEAAWRLTESLRGQPMTAARLSALLQDRRLLGALRAFGTPSEPWAARLLELQDSTGLLATQAVTTRSLLLDARGPRTTARGFFLEGNQGLALLGERRESAAGRLFLLATGGGPDLGHLVDAALAERARAASPFFRWLQGPLEKPYLRLCAADYAAASASSYAAALAQADRCAPRPATDGGTPGRIARFSLLGDGGSLDRIAHTTAVLAAEAELTGLVLRLRAERAQSTDPGWPRQLSGLESTACAGRRWIYEIEADGRAHLHLDPNPFEEREATVSYRMSER